MAEYEITIKYENDNYFKVTAKKNNEDKKTICMVEENGFIHSAIPHHLNALKTYINELCVVIEGEMKA